MMTMPHADVVQPDSGALTHAARVVATPALLASSTVVWAVLWTSGVPGLAASLATSTLVVAGILVLELTAPRPGLARRASGTLASDIAFTATTTVFAVVLPSLLVVPLGRAAGIRLGTQALWPARLPLWASA